MNKTLVEVSNLTKTFHSDQGEIKALDGVSFSVSEGETLGVVGESGCGKTTLGRVLAGLVRRDEGTVAFADKTRRKQIIFQDPYNSVDPYWTVERIVMETCNDRNEAIQLLNKVGLGIREKDSYPHELSGGQLQRVGIARALGAKPDFIVCDEPVSALDVSYQSKIISLLEELQQQEHLTYLFISHDLAVVRHIADRIMIMYNGQIMEIGETGEIIKNPVHPYTEFLLSAVPSPFEKKDDFDIRDDKVVSRGCPFAPRCPYRQEICLQKRCELKMHGDGHLVACHVKEK